MSEVRVSKNMSIIQSLLLYVESVLYYDKELQHAIEMIMENAEVYSEDDKGNQGYIIVMDKELVNVELDKAISESFYYITSYYSGDKFVYVLKHVNNNRYNIYRQGRYNFIFDNHGEWLTIKNNAVLSDFFCSEEALACSTQDEALEFIKKRGTSSFYVNDEEALIIINLIVNNADWYANRSTVVTSSNFRDLMYDKHEIPLYSDTTRCFYTEPERLIYNSIKS